MVKAPGLMRSGSSVEIFQQSFQGRGLKYDCDGFVEAYRVVARQQIAEAEANGWTEIDYLGRLIMVLGQLGVQEPSRSQLAVRAWDDYLAEWPKQTSFYPETPAVLERLRGEYKLGVVTNFMDGPTARKVFHKLGYEAIFDSLVVSSEVGYMKPSSIIFDRALKELNSKPGNCVMVGDSYPADVVGAHRSGMKGILIDLGGVPEEQRSCSDAVIEGISEFPDVLRRL